MFWLGLVISLCYVPGITGAYIATQLPVLAVLLPFALFRSGPFTAFHLLGVLFVAYAAAWLPWSPNLYGGVYGLWIVVIMALSAWFGTTAESMRELYKGLAIGAAASSLVAVLQFFGVDVVPTSSISPAGLYVNSVQQGTVLALVAVALVTERMWPWALPLAPGIWLAHSRGGVIVLLVGLLGHFTRNLWASAGAFALAVPFYLLYPLSSSDAQRTYIWHVAWDNLTWFGWGAGTFYSAVFSQNGVPFIPEYAHNEFLQLAFEYGVAAALPITVIAYAVWRSDVAEWPVVLAFCAAACFSMPFFMPIASFLAFAAVGRVLRVHGLHGGYGNLGRRDVFSGFGARRLAACRGNLPLASHHSAKG